MPAMSHLHKNMCWIWSQAACTCRTYLHKKVHIISSLFWYSLVYYLNDLVVGILSLSNENIKVFSLQESNQERRLPSPPEIEYGDWSAKNVEETEFQRTARILGVLFPAPPISSATPIPGMANAVAERRSAQGYSSPDPNACYLEVRCPQRKNPVNIWRLPFRLPARPRATRASVCFCPTERLTPVSRPPFRYCAWSRPQEQRAKENKIGIQISFLNLEQVLPCNDRPCPVDCRWDHWSPWSPCTGISVDNMNFRN